MRKSFDRFTRLSALEMRVSRSGPVLVCGSDRCKLERDGLTDGIRFQCRVRELGFFEPTSVIDRITRVAASIEKLGSGRFIIGLGPNCQEVVRVGKHPVRFGRPASPLEEHRDELVDIAVNDAALYGPREVSRVHCTIDPGGCQEDEVRLIDDGSSTGTWLHPSGLRLDAHSPVSIPSAALFSLGPSGVNMFLFVSM